MGEVHRITRFYGICNLDVRFLCESEFLFVSRAKRGAEFFLKKRTSLSNMTDRLAGQATLFKS